MIYYLFVTLVPKFSLGAVTFYSLMRKKKF